MKVESAIETKKEDFNVKTIQELYSEVMESQELKAQFIEAAKAGKQEAFLKEHGCEATLEEVKDFMEAKQKEDAPLSLDELDSAAGGECNAQTGGETAVSIVTLGFGCAVWVATSTVGVIVGEKTVGQYKEGDGRLCNLPNIKK